MVFDDRVRFELRVPVLVVGAGACGLVAALAGCAAFADGRGVDPCGRDFARKPKLAPPYFAVKVTGAGAHVWGYLSGNGLLTAVTLGRIAGAGAAAANV